MRKTVPFTGMVDKVDSRTKLTKKSEAWGNEVFTVQESPAEESDASVINFNSEDMTLPGQILNVSLEGIIDTGSALTVVSEKLVNDLDYLTIREPRIPRIVGIGNYQKVTGETTLTFHADGKELELDCLIVEKLVPRLIIGRDTLNKFVSKIDMKNGKLHFTEDIAHEEIGCYVLEPTVLNSPPVKQAEGKLVKENDQGVLQKPHPRKNWSSKFWFGKTFWLSVLIILLSVYFCSVSDNPDEDMTVQVEKKQCEVSQSVHLIFQVVFQVVLSPEKPGFLKTVSCKFKSTQRLDGFPSVGKRHF